MDKLKKKNFQAKYKQDVKIVIFEFHMDGCMEYLFTNHHDVKQGTTICNFEISMILFSLFRINTQSVGPYEADVDARERQNAHDLVRSYETFSLWISHITRETQIFCMLEATSRQLRHVFRIQRLFRRWCSRLANGPVSAGDAEPESECHSNAKSNELQEVLFISFSWVQRPVEAPCCATARKEAWRLRKTVGKAFRACSGPVLGTFLQMAVQLRAVNLTTRSLISVKKKLQLDAPPKGRRSQSDLTQ